MNEGTAGGANIMTRLREETMPLHKETESGSFQVDLLSGRLPLDSYTDLLEQLLLAHRALERNLGRMAESHAAFRQVIHERQFQERNLTKDLLHFARDPNRARALPATQSFIDWIEETARSMPMALLGIHYVLEGSKNGGRFIAKAIRRAYSLAAGAGTCYLDPHGDDQQTFWQEFKTSMNRVDLTGAEADSIVEAAKETFRGIVRIHQELHAAVRRA